MIYTYMYMHMCIYIYIYICREREREKRERKEREKRERERELFSHADPGLPRGTASRGSHFSDRYFINAGCLPKWRMM